MSAEKTIIRVSKHTDRYTVIDNTGLNDPRLSMAATGLLAHLLAQKDDYEIVVEGLKARFPNGRDAIRTALKELKEAGYAQLSVVRATGGLATGKRWVIFENPNDGKTAFQSFGDDRKTAFQAFGETQAQVIEFQEVEPKAWKTESLKNRKPEKPIQVNTINSNLNLFNVNVNSEFDVETLTPTEKKEPSDFEETPTPTPQVAPPPPPPSLPELLFEKSGWLQAGPAAFGAALLQAYPELHEVNTTHYFNRCKTWSSRKEKRSTNWLRVAYSLCLADQAEGKLKLHQQNTAPHAKSSPSGSDSAEYRQRIINRTKNILEGLGYQTGT